MIDRRRRQRLGDVGREQGGATAVAHQRVLARIEAPHGQTSAHRFRHLGQGDLSDPPRRGLCVQTQASTERGAGRHGGVAVEDHVAAQEVLRIDVAKNDQGVGHRGLVPAPSIAHRSGARPRRLRSHAAASRGRRPRRWSPHPPRWTRHQRVAGRSRCPSDRHAGPATARRPARATHRRTCRPCRT